MTNYLNKEGLTRLINIIKTKLNGKVDKVEGKDLSSNDFNNEYKEKLDNLGDAIVMHELPIGSIIGFDGTEIPDGWEVIEDSGDESSSSITKYKLIIEQDSAAGAEVLLPGNYIVGAKAMAIYLNGERLVLSTDANGTDGHYVEVGTDGAESNKIQLTSDWNLEAGDILEVVIEVSGVSQIVGTNNQKAIIAMATMTENYTTSTTTNWKTKMIPFTSLSETDELTLEENQVKIGKGISKILISAVVNILESLEVTGKIIVVKNNIATSYNATIRADTEYSNLILTPQVIEVQEGDIVSVAIQFSSPQSSITVKADSTYMTIQAVTPLIEDDSATTAIVSEMLPITSAEAITEYEPVEQFHLTTKKYVDSKETILQEQIDELSGIDFNKIYTFETVNYNKHLNIPGITSLEDIKNKTLIVYNKDMSSIYGNEKLYLNEEETIFLTAVTKYTLFYNKIYIMVYTGKTDNEQLIFSEDYNTAYVSRLNKNGSLYTIQPNTTATVTTYFPKGGMSLLLITPKFTCNDYNMTAATAVTKKVTVEVIRKNTLSSSDTGTTYATFEYYYDSNKKINAGTEAIIVDNPDNKYYNYSYTIQVTPEVQTGFAYTGGVNYGSGYQTKNFRADMIYLGLDG